MSGIPDLKRFAKGISNHQQVAWQLRVRSYVAIVAIATIFGCGQKAKDVPKALEKTHTQNMLIESKTTKTPKRSNVQWKDRAIESGVVWQYDNDTGADRSSIVETIGGGGALFDFDRDGALDLFLTGGGRFSAEQTTSGRSSALFWNRGSWRYQAVSRQSATEIPRHYTHGATVADYDEDGFDDLLVTGYGGLQLFRNLGDGTFEDSTVAAQLEDSLWSTSAAWGDIDNDGDLDLYVAHYVNWSFENDPPCPSPFPNKRDVCSPKLFDGLPDVLYCSNGDGTFIDLSRTAGLRQDGKGLGVLTADFDLDGLIDVYVANDTTPKFLYHNLGGGKFEEIGNISGTALSDAATADGSMGVAVGDFNDDGLPDIWVANYERESFALYRNEGQCSFQHVSQLMGVTAVGSLFVGFGTVFLDADRDGDEDIWVTNGHVIKYPINSPVKQLPLYFENVQGQRFVNRAPEAGQYSAAPHLGRGVAKGDLDNDGDIDLVVSHILEPVAVLDNVSPNRNNWLEVHLIGRTSNRSAIGAQLSLSTSAGTRIRQVSGGGSYLCHSDSRVHWGFPPDVKLNGLTIRWPSGIRQTVSIQQNSQIVLLEPGSE